MLLVTESTLTDVAGVHKSVSVCKSTMPLCRGLTLLTSVCQACGPLWAHECGSSYYSTGICSRVNASFKFSRAVAPAFQSKTKTKLFFDYEDPNDVLHCIN